MRHKALSTIAFISIITAILIACAAVIGIFYSIAAEQPIILLVSVLSLLIFPLIFAGFGELIYLFISIEKNVRKFHEQNAKSLPKQRKISDEHAQKIATWLQKNPGKTVDDFYTHFGIKD
jgi:hypothetical protein